jgi:general L-amino acid transport system permease protein|tara:strand:- start:769 stop:2094 length:1326 start_codon:yes stop_codon:yes gene_type:complete
VNQVATSSIVVRSARWARENLFSSWTNTILSLICIVIIYNAVWSVFSWAILNGVWEAKDRRDCFAILGNDEAGIPIAGACWAGVREWFNNMMFGRYFKDEQWRVILGFVILIVWLIPLWVPGVKRKFLIAAGAIGLYPFLAAYLFLGGERSWFMSFMVPLAMINLAYNTIDWVGDKVFRVSLADTLRWKLVDRIFPEKQHTYALIALFAVLAVIVGYLIRDWGLVNVPWVRFGGFFLTFLLSGIGITVALPVGIILALGRRSQLPIIKALTVTFIEVFRSVPLITILFMATAMFPLFMPEGYELNKLTQVIAAICLFSSCYMAEVVRSGLQAIPKGQYEAASSIGLGYWQSMGLVVMPQALKFMIPNIVGNFIGLFKDTTLVYIVGMFDILAMTRAMGNDVPWRGEFHEPFLVTAVIFFVFCFTMSRYSQHLERKLGGEQK